MTNSIIINLTPHAIVLMDEGNAPILTIPSSGILARCKETVVPAGRITINGITIPLTKKTLGDVQNLPDQQDGVALIVSLAVAKACPNRKDLLIPNEAVRNADGQIIGCRSLSPLND